MAEIVPTILARTPGQYHERLEQIKAHTKRIHVDITDGKFATTQTINLAQVYVPEGYELDLHLMVKNPMKYLESALALKPTLIIIHVEAYGDLDELLKEIQSFGVDAGVALLQETQVQDHAPLIQSADHALVFTGDLGHSGGTLDHHQLHKLADLKLLKPSIETSVDGGVNIENMGAIEADVLYAGAGYLEMVA